ncbi:MAG: hypothetical protein LBF84_04120 [Holosporales bacterium]|nr:hypothetical protein [Holosporales bacterium]
MSRFVPLCAVGLAFCSGASCPAQGLYSAAGRAVEAARTVIKRSVPEIAVLIVEKGCRYVMWNYGCDGGLWNVPWFGLWFVRKCAYARIAYHCGCAALNSGRDWIVDYVAPLQEKFQLQTDIMALCKDLEELRKEAEAMKARKILSGNIFLSNDPDIIAMANLFRECEMYRGKRVVDFVVDHIKDHVVLLRKWNELLLRVKTWDNIAEQITAAIVEADRELRLIYDQRSGLHEKVNRAADQLHQAQVNLTNATRVRIGTDAQEIRESASSISTKTDVVLQLLAGASDDSRTFHDTLRQMYGMAEGDAPVVIDTAFNQREALFEKIRAALEKTQTALRAVPDSLPRQEGTNG